MCTYWTMACPGLAVSRSDPPGTLSLSSAGHTKMLNTYTKFIHFVHLPIPPVQ